MAYRCKASPELCKPSIPKNYTDEQDIYGFNAYADSYTERNIPYRQAFVRVFDIIDGQTLKESSTSATIYAKKCRSCKPYDFHMARVLH